MERKESNRENGELRFNPRKITFWLKKLKLYHKHKGKKSFWKQKKRHQSIQVRAYLSSKTMTINPIWKHPGNFKYGNFKFQIQFNFKCERNSSSGFQTEKENKDHTTKKQAGVRCLCNIKCLSSGFLVRYLSLFFKFAMMNMCYLSK